MPEKKAGLKRVRQPGAERRDRIAVAAYYNAQGRGFQPGGEIDDWLEAERQIDGETAAETPQPVYRPVNLNVREDIQGRDRPSPLDAGLPDEPDERIERRGTRRVA